MVTRFCGAEEQSLVTVLASPRPIYSRNGFLNEKDPLCNRLTSTQVKLLKMQMFPVTMAAITEWTYSG
jgi:hypothetical protein